MNASTRVGGFALGLVAVAGAATLLGAAVGPVGAQPQEHDAQHGAAHEDGGEEMNEQGGHGGAHAGHGTGGSAVPGGLLVSQDGYTLRLLDDSVAPARRSELRFQVTGADGEPVTEYERSHGKDLHLIAVRRDLTGFQHVHPTLAADGTWSTTLDLGAPGEWRVFTDFKPAGAESGYTLGHDLAVRGDYSPEELPAPAATTTVDGYEVALDGELVPGRTSELTLTVTRGGEPVTDLEPYLEAYGHLVALRDGDLAYLHVHPDGEPGDGRTEPGPEITFYAEVPSAGAYRLFLDFQHDGVVRTAELTAVAGPAGDEVSAPATGDAEDHEAGAHQH